MNALPLLATFKRSLDRELAAFFDHQSEIAVAVDPAARDMVELLREFTLRGGKRVRAAFLYYGFKCFHSGNETALLRAAMSMELAQSYLLVHDDIIDNDVERRGGPTLHRAYGALLRRASLGKPMALIAGDVAAHLAQHALLTVKLSPRYKERALVEFNRMLPLVAYGEALDVLSGTKSLTEKDVLKVYRYKTASYTVEGPLRIGALLAGAKSGRAFALSSYGVPLGIAFQLQDDILGLFGSERHTGKSNVSDLREGKQTLLIVKALENGTKRQQRIVRRYLGRKLTSAQGNAVRDVIVGTGSLDYCRQLARSLVQEAKAALDPRLRKEGRDFLRGIADYVLDRRY